MKKIKFIDYLNKDADFKPVCHRCGYRDHVWSLDDVWICKECLTKEELFEIVSDVEETLLLL